MANSAAGAAAERLIQASESATPCPPVRDLIGSDDQDLAYLVQQLVTQHRVANGARLVGRKIGLTSGAVQKQLGVDKPDFGVLFEDMMYTDGATVTADAVLQARVEAELAFVLNADLVAGPLDVDQVRAATAYVLPALEICGSRIAGWDITFADTVADNASAGAVVLGGTPIKLDDVDTAGVVMSMTIDGVEASTGSGRSCMGDPANAVAWLAQVSRENGSPLRAGEVVMSGALGPMCALEPGATVATEITGVGTVTMSYGEGKS